MSALEIEPPDLEAAAPQPNITRFVELDLSHLEKLPVPDIVERVRGLNVTLATWATTQELSEKDQAFAEHTHKQYVEFGIGVSTLINDVAAPVVYQETGRCYQVQFQVGGNQAGVPVWAFERHPEALPQAVPAQLAPDEVFPLTRLR